MRRDVLRRALVCVVVSVAGCPAPEVVPNVDVGPDDTGLAPIDATVAPDVLSGIDAPAVFDAARDTPMRDVPRDTGPEPTPAEEAACANLGMLSAMCGGTFDESLCLSSRVNERIDLADPDCYAEYDAWVACLTTWSECSSGAGVPCPSEYGAFGACVMGGRP